jgi:ABC-2 type transport system permease protein
MSSRWYPFGQLVLARLREFYREPVALFWVYGFPMILALGLGIAFSRREPEAHVVDVQTTPGSDLADEIKAYLEKNGVRAETNPAGECSHRLKTGKTELFLVAYRDAGILHVKFHYDKARSEADAARDKVTEVLDRYESKPPLVVDDPKLLDAPGTRYIDFLMPGLIAMNLMGGGMWGIGFVLVEMRTRKLLKRLLATPMRRGDFLLALLTSRMILVVPEMAIMVSVAVFLFRVPLEGSLLILIVTILLSAAAFSGLGLLIASRTEKTETVSGLMNLVMLPQWLLSGAFFSSKRFPDAAQPFIQALPLTQVIDALREVMLEGTGLSVMGWRLGVLAVWGVVSFALALRWFRWR